jgi:hypothetical protein
MAPAAGTLSAMAHRDAPAVAGKLDPKTFAQALLAQKSPGSASKRARAEEQAEGPQKAAKEPGMEVEAPLLPPPSEAAITSDFSAPNLFVLQRKDGEHISGKQDLEDLIAAAEDNITELQRKMVAAASSISELPGGFKMINAINGGHTGVAITFECELTATCFGEFYHEGGFLCKGIDYLAISGADFYSKSTNAELKGTDSDQLALIYRNIPDASAELSKYIAHAETEYGSVIKSCVNKLEWGGIQSKYEDGSILIVVQNDKKVTSLSKTPFYINGTQVGALSFQSGQVACLNHKLCKANGCRALDGHHVLGCDYKKQKEVKEQNRKVAQKKSFLRKLQNKADTVNGIRLMLKARAERENLGYCNRFNQSGIPCVGCRFSPCSEWEHLMETTLSESVYKELPDAIRKKNQRSRGVAAGAKRKGKPLEGEVSMSEDDEDL